MTAQAVEAAPSRAAQVFRPLTVMLMVVAGVFAFSAYFVLSAYAPDLRGGGDDGGANALSRSAIGYAGFVRLLQADGLAAPLARDGPAKRDPAWSLLVITPEAGTKPSDVVAFKSAAGPTLLVLPKWTAQPDDANPGWVKQTGLLDTDDVKALLGATAVIARRADTTPLTLSSTDVSVPRLQAGPIARLQTINAPGMTTVLSDQTGASVLVRTADAQLYILSDPDLLNTQGIKNLQTAEAGVGLLQDVRLGAGPIAFDVSLNGYKTSPSVLKLALQPPFLGATLTLLGVAVLMGFHALSRFGAPQRSARALALGKRALAENSAGLIRMAKREPHMAGGYLDLSRGAVAKALGATRLSGGELDGYIDKVGERVGLGSFSALAGEVATIRDRDGVTRFAQRLYQWRLEMTRERR
jgi:hypothetical protein